MKIQNKGLKSLFLVGLLGLAACQKQSHTLDDLTGQSSQDQNQGIIGGVPVDSKEDFAKHVVALADPWGAFCTGVLVKKNVVLTAAHCTDMGPDPRVASIVFGTDLKNPVATRKILGGKVTDKWPSLTTAEQNDLRAEWGDIAMIKFEGEAPEGFEPARILGNPIRLEKGLDVILAGYGNTAKKPTVQSDVLRKTVVKLSDPKFTPSEIMFEQHNGTGACHGDSGGPAFTVLNGKLFLIGITSRTATFAGAQTCMEGSVYTNVATQLDFLVKTAKFLDSQDFVPGQPFPQPR